MEAGFARVDEHFVDVVAEDVSQETENLDQRFTPKVVAHWNQIQEEIKTSGKTYSKAELDDCLSNMAGLEH